MSTKDEREKRRATFSASKQALLEKRLQGIAEHEEPPVTIPKRPEKEKAPASFSQQRLWFLQQLEPDNSAYNETRTVHITLPLERDSLKQALCEIMRRHEILRTNIVFVDGQVQQVIHPYEEALHHFSLHEIDLQEVAAEEQKRAVDQYLKAFVLQPFDLAKHMLWKVTWIKIGQEDSLLVLVIHHILCDGWGLDIFETEIKALYEMFRREEASPLPELAIQYADFAYWQQHYLKTEHLEQQLTYWRQILSNLPEQQLLRGENHPHEQGSAGARLSFTVPSTLTQQLQALSLQEGVTLFMTLLAAFQILLCHYSEQTDILIGSPIANRMRPEFEPLIGCFINTLILRTNLSGNPTVRELLQRVRATALGAYAHQDVPFEKLVEELSPKREVHRNPFFQVLFTFQNYQQTSANPALPSGNTTDWQVDLISSKFDLDLMMWESEGTLRGDFSYNSKLFTTSTIMHIQQHFLMVLSDIAMSCAKHLSDIPGLTEAERLEYPTWNNSSVSVLPSDTSTPSLDEGPHSPLEEILVMLWAEMLEKEQITTHTNFFDAGGYSLQAIRLLARIQDVLAIEIPLRLIFDAPTVTSFAEALLKDECQREQIEKNIELMLSVAQLSEDEVATMLQETE